MKRPTMPASEAMRAAERLAARGDVEEATRYYNAVLTQDPTNKKARKGLRDLQERTDAPLSPADFDRVNAYLRAGRVDAAHTEIRRLRKRHPDQPALPNLHGAILARLGDREAAAEAFRDALRLEPGLAEALGNLAAVLADLGRYEEALGAYRELLRRGQETPELYNSLGIALRGAGLYDEAVEAYRRATRLRPVFPDAYNNLGNVLNDLGRHDEALAAYERALELAPTHRRALLNRIQSLASLGRHRATLQALAAYREHYDAETPTTLRVAADALLALGQRTAARETLEALVRLEPDNAIARHRLGALAGTGASVADPAYARAVFEAYAARFEEHLTEKLEYRLPEQLPGILKRIDGEDAWYERALDIGCGTGLVGAQIRGFCSELLGVDVAPAMVEKAREKAVYDELAVAAISTWLDSTPATFDLLICADVLPYIGAVDGLFAKIAARMNPGARLIVSTERAEEEEDDLKLRETGRYVHGDAYLRRCAGDAGLTVTAASQIRLRKERGEGLEGSLFVFTRPGEV